MTGTSAIVTGHSRGLGEAIAAHLLARGIPVLGIARRTNETLQARHGRALVQAQLDLADPAAVTAWARGDALPTFLRGTSTALLVNNAGMLQPVGPLPMQDLATIARAVSLNVSAALVLSAAFVRATADARDRRILHISSGAGSNPYAGWSIYCATKAALDHHARAVALDGTASLRIGSVAPGIIDTDMQAEIRGTTDDAFPDRPRFVELKREGRLRSPDEAGRDVVELLLSREFGSDAVTDLRRVTR